MKNSIIKEIYYGKRGHYETIKASKVYWKLIGEAAEVGDALLKDLTEEQKALFKKLNLLEINMSAETALMNFIEGFKTGRYRDHGASIPGRLKRTDNLTCAAD